MLYIEQPLSSQVGEKYKTTYYLVLPVRQFRCIYLCEQSCWTETASPSRLANGRRNLDSCCFFFYLLMSPQLRWIEQLTSNQQVVDSSSTGDAMREWRNWQTRWIQVPILKRVWVRVPSLVPINNFLTTSLEAILEGQLSYFSFIQNVYIT